MASNKIPSRIGEISYTNRGHHKMTIIEYHTNQNVIVEFEDGSTKKVTYQSFRLGEVSFENRYNGKIFTCANGGYCKVINREKGDGYCLVEFDGIENQRCSVYYSNLIKGLIKNPWSPSVSGVGYIGKQFDGTLSKSNAYKHWCKMLDRCYNSSNKKYKFYGAKGVKVCDEWLCYANYERWFNDHFYEIENEDMVVDKDLLIKGNKIYDEEHCVIVPKTINLALTKADSIRGDYPIGVSYRSQNNNYIASITINDEFKHLGCYSNSTDAFYAYKKAKEDYLKQLADKYKGIIPQNVYDALYAYEVEITD